MQILGGKKFCEEEQKVEIHHLEMRSLHLIPINPRILERSVKGHKTAKIEGMSSFSKKTDMM